MTDSFPSRLCYQEEQDRKLAELLLNMIDILQAKFVEKGLTICREGEREKLKLKKAVLRKPREYKRKCNSLCLLLRLVTPFIERKGVLIIVTLQKVILFGGHDTPKVVL